MQPDKASRFSVSHDRRQSGGLVPRVRAAADRFRSSRDGVVAVMFAFGSVLVFGTVGAAVDHSAASGEKVRLQAALDAATISETRDLKANSTQQQIQDGIAKFLASHLASTSGITLTVTYDKDKRQVRAIATKSHEARILPVIGIPSIPIRVEAAAVLNRSTPCILVLEPQEIGLSINSQSRLDSDCGVQVNSRHAEALFVNSNSHLSARETLVHGRTRVNGGSTVIATPVDGSPTVPDPLAMLQPPNGSTGGCLRRNFKVSSGQSRTMSPGVYCGKTEIEGWVTLQPGIYTFRGGGFVVNSGGNVFGQEVTLYFQDKDAHLNVNSGSTLDITASSTGSFAGILLYQDRALANAGAPPFIINSNSSTRLEGTVYLPQGRLELNSSSVVNRLAAYTTIVSRWLVLNSGGHFVVRSWSGGKTPMPVGLGSTVSSVRLVQ